MTRVVAVDPDRPDPEVLAEAAAILRSGGLVAFGTETVYGLGADATNPTAVARIFAAKGRPPTNPLIVHAADVRSARTCVAEWPDSANLLVHRFWPGPLTLVLPRSELIPDIVTAGQDTVGIRVPRSVAARELIRLTGVPVAAPSANRSNRISPTLAAHVLHDLDGLVDLILDTGPCWLGIESTVLDLTSPTPTILRPGDVTEAVIFAAIGQSVARFAGVMGVDQAAASPGQQAIHYAPQTRTFRLASSSLPAFDPSETLFWAAIVLGEISIRFNSHFAEAVLVLGDPVTAAAGLYEALHRLDKLELDFLVIVTPPDDEPGWLAVLDRVIRATLPWPVGDTEPR